MADLLSIVRVKLLTDGVANAGSWKCWIGHQPDTADQMISLILTGGFAQDTQLGENVHQTFQCTVRSARSDYAVCENKWWDMFRSLNDANLVADGINLIQALASGPMHYEDEKNRTCMTCNFRVVREMPT